MAAKGKKQKGSHVEDTLGAKHLSVILRYAETPSLSVIPTLNGSDRAKWMARINKCTGDKRRVRVWVDHADSTTRTGVLPTIHRRKGGPGEKNGH